MSICSSAVENPACMAILLDLRLVEISFMVRDAEKGGNHGDIELFMTTMRFALALFTVTHATNYAHIVCDFLEWWELSSEADKIFFKNWLYTKVSPFGKPIWVDRGVEWTIRHIRMFLGKRAYTNQEQRMEEVVPDIPFRIKAKNELQHLLGYSSSEDGSWTSVDWNKQTTNLSNVYFQTLTTIYDTNLWGQGNLSGPFECDNSSSHFMHFETGQAEPMSKTFLSAFDLGQSRAIAYFQQHHIYDRQMVRRSEDNVSLKLLPTEALLRKRDLHRLKTVRLSIEVNELIPLTREFPVKDILKELDELRQCVYPEIPVFSTAGVARKTLLECLCVFRAQYFQEFPNVYESTLVSVEAIESDDALTTPESRQQQAKSLIYSLDIDAIDVFNQKYHYE